MSTDAVPARHDEARHAVRRAWRLYRSVVRQWTNNGANLAAAHHQLRVQRLQRTWPQLAQALDGLAAASIEHDPGELPYHDKCGSPIERVHADPDPRTAEQVFTLRPCGCVVDRDTALWAWNAGVDVTVTPVNGSTLAAAERQRQRVEEGHSIDADLARHGDGELTWAAWCLLDRASSDTVDAGQGPPPMWPWHVDAWPRHRAPLRLLVIAAALLQADIDRRLAAGETMTGDTPEEPR